MGKYRDYVQMCGFQICRFNQHLNMFVEPGNPRKAESLEDCVLV